MKFNKLELSEKFGQMILLGLDVYEINDEIIDIIKTYKIGGIVLYKKNYTSIESMKDVINKLKKINSVNKIPLFISIDQENGRVNRLPKEIHRIYSANKQARSKDLNIINDCNELTSYLLRSVGVNMNFAPTLDIVRNKKNKVIGNRSYGSALEDVMEYGIPYMKTLQKYNIVSVVKHFPGHGATNKDSHFMLPKIQNIQRLELEDIKVFEAAIKNQVDAIMVEHLLVKDYGFTPVSLNKKFIDKYLRNKLNFKGVIVTDDLRMSSLKNVYGLKRSVKKSIDAGCNMLIIKYKKGDFKRLYKKLFDMVKYCEIDPELINLSSKKVLSLKDKYNITDELINSTIDIKRINKKIDELNNMIDKKILL